MKQNRRNYYRILHVQPEAPFEVIRASYRTLMGTLKMHPDFRGDHDAAALINTAWQTLSDPASRTAYDRTLTPNAPRATADSQQGTVTHRPGQSASPKAKRIFNPLNCPFCDKPKPTLTKADTKCAGCSGPLGSPPERDGSPREFWGRRWGSRFAKDQPVFVYVEVGDVATQGRLQELSLHGASFLLSVPVLERQVLRLLAKDFEALVSARNVQRNGTIWTVRSMFLSVMFTRQKGTIVSAVA